MAIKKYKPTSPGRRLQTALDFAELSGDAPRKALLSPLKKSGGRNATGRITSRHRGGGHKRRYRAVDYKRAKDGVPARVESLQYDPNRSARIALLGFADGDKRYVIAPANLEVGDSVVSGKGSDIKVGNCLPLAHIPTGTVVHGVELKPGAGAQLVRSAGVGAQLVAKEGDYALLRLPSGELRKVRSACRATIGQVGNAQHENVRVGKAGRSRWRGRRPQTRGIAMNPVDHPHGGGEGRAKGNHPQSPWGQPTKGYRTRGKRPSDKYIVARRKRRKGS